LTALIEDIVNFLSPQKRFRNVNLSKDLDKSLPEMVADPSQLSQLFYNLLNNAAQALNGQKDAGINITTLYSQESQEVTIDLADNGPGVPQELIDKAFSTRFTTKSGGHGIGLIVCAKVVNNHDGKIKVEHGPNGGTVFTITLPVKMTLEEIKQEPLNITGRVNI